MMWTTLIRSGWARRWRRQSDQHTLVWVCLSISDNPLLQPKATQHRDFICSTSSCVRLGRRKRKMLIYSSQRGLSFTVKSALVSADYHNSNFFCSIRHYRTENHRYNKHLQSPLHNQTHAHGLQMQWQYTIRRTELSNSRRQTHTASRYKTHTLDWMKMYNAILFSCNSPFPSSSQYLLKSIYNFKKEIWKKKERKKNPIYITNS